MANSKPLVIIDTSVVTRHAIDHKTDSKGQVIIKLSNKARDTRLAHGYQLYNTLFWLKNIRAEDWDVIWVGDSKKTGYWRTGAVRSWLDSLDSEDPRLIKRKNTRLGYKGNRNTCPYRQWVHGQMNNVIAKPLIIDDYEADDVAAAVVKLNPDRKILLATVDSDWLQMVSENVHWCCLTGFNPQYRDQNTGVDWFIYKMSQESKVNQSLVDPTDLREIVKWKSLVGDTSDNLPAGTPEEFIDLFNPPEQHKLWLRPGISDLISQAIKPATPDSDGDIIDDWEDNYGFTTTKYTNQTLYEI